MPKRRTTASESVVGSGTAPALADAGPPKRERLFPFRERTLRFGLIVAGKLSEVGFDDLTEVGREIPANLLQALGSFLGRQIAPT